jgi:hypothetical protein
LRSPPSRTGSAASAAADSLPFRAGQWGAEFAVDNGMVGLGALRFRSPRSAWLVDAMLALGGAEGESSAGDEEDRRSTFVSLRTGPRRYRPLGRSVASFVGAGLLGSYAWQELSAADRRETTWQAGLYGELGAAYFVTDRLSLGAQASVDATYGGSRTVIDLELLSSESSEQRWQLSTSRVRIIGGLYF